MFILETLLPNNIIFCLFLIVHVQDPRAEMKTVHQEGQETVKEKEQRGKDEIEVMRIMKKKGKRRNRNVSNLMRYGNYLIYICDKII